MKLLTPHHIGQPVARTEGREKVTGSAVYSYEHAVADVAYGWLVPATIASGTVTGVDVEAARRLDGVLDVLWHGNAAHLSATTTATIWPR